MEPKEEVIVDETVLSEEEIESFDWEDHMYETWLEERRERGRRKTGEAGV
jgi:hypothetical protein